MVQKKKEHPKEKSGLHKRNKHRERYNFKQLIASCPELEPFVTLNIYQDETVDFFNPDAVKMLNTALLKQYYDIEWWDIPTGYLCPPIPGRADYIHRMADLLASKNFGSIPQGEEVKCLDIGVGANCIYPIIGSKEYGWSFVGSDIDEIAVASANKIIESNTSLQGKVEIRFQTDRRDIFYGFIGKDEPFDLSVCNPPYHATAEEAQTVAKRKLKNLKHKKVEKPVLNFGGQPSELVCDGGEEKFVNQMIRQSKKFSSSCFWFSSLVAKQSHTKSVLEALKKVEAVEVVTIPMGQGNKTSRVIAWTFLTAEEQKNWREARWVV